MTMPMDEEKTKNFLRLIRRSARGRLKVYLGYCAGVGKTYRMLQEGNMLRSEGIDVVAGFVETHGRLDVERLQGDLEIIPRLVREYRGIQVEEMDVDGVIARKPAVALVDELAHDNVPGSRNSKRYQDVQEILAAGIHVITTLNVQHLESLYNTVEKHIGVRVRERLPDTVLTEADQIVDVDLSTEDLRKRLREGKIYQKDRVETALENFFTTANLEKLRELALRELAAHIDMRSRREPTPEEAAAIPDQVLVCLSSRGPNSELLLRYASRFAGRLNKNWYALYVQRDAEDPTHISIQTQASLSNTLTLAKQLGAIVFTYKGEDLASTILRFAREYRIGHIIVGTPARASFLDRLLLRKNLSERLILEARGINIVVVDTTQPPVLDDSRKMDAVAMISDSIHLSDFLHEDNVVAWEEAVLKEEVLRDLFAAAYGRGPDGNASFKELLRREQESSTFFNEGVAFPHLRIKGDFPPRLSLGVIPRGITDLTTLVPVRLVFMILSSCEQPEIQAKFLAAASRIASDRLLVERLLSSRVPGRILREISNWESSHPGNPG